MKNLVLVESPSKAKTIEKYLGKDYKVEATLGHIIDLPSNKLSVKVDEGYEPEFSVIEDKKKVISKLKKHLPKKKEGKVYLAMDPDREGEAIAYHAANALGLKNDQYVRVTFHEITKNAVKKAMEKPGNIDDNLVEAQFARRVLDRLVGYKVSGVLWKKMWYGLSAGRVQSAALRLIVEREREIEKFKPDEYWDVIGNFDPAEKGKNKLVTDLYKKADKKYKPGSEKEFKELKDDFESSKADVSSVKEKIRNRSAYPPFTTSTLQQAANNVLGFSSKKTMAVAQQLYQAGYITYMRTDSVNLAKQAIDKIRKRIESDFGKEYLPEKPNYYKSKARLAQEAHEAIRPTQFSKKQRDEVKKIGKDKVKLYELIYKRAVSSQMMPRKMKILTIILEGVGKSGTTYQFKTTGQKILFEGWYKMWESKGSSADGNKDSLQLVEGISEGDKYTCKKIEGEQKFTQPRPRYTEASLVKALEKHGIGRPSTYSSIISTLLSRKYVNKEGKSLLPTDIGRVVNNFLENYFERLVNYEYTANVEEDLDKIAEGKKEYKPFMDSQYKPLIDEIEKVKENVDKEDVVVLDESDEKCPECGTDMIVKIGRYGKFLSCSKFPDCTGIKSLGEDGKEALSAENLDQDKYVIPEKCPKCDGELVLKSGRYGKFWACKDYPKCKGTVPMLLKEECPECGSKLVERKGKWGKMFIGCSGYPDCKYIKGRKKKSGKKSNSKKKSKRKGKK